jgi:hypothetical protein
MNELLLLRRRTNLIGNSLSPQSINTASHLLKKIEKKILFQLIIPRIKATMKYYKNKDQI